MSGDTAVTTAPPPRVRATPRRVLGIAVAVVLTGGLLTWLAPQVLPVRVIEGPLVQMTGPDHATIVWFTSKSADCSLERTAPPAAAEYRRIGRRHVGVFRDLEPGEAVPYAIRSGERILFADRVRAPRRGREPFSFLIFGDSGRGNAEQYRLARVMTECTPDFLVHTGDLVYGDGARGDYAEKFFRPYRDLLARVPFWPCLGNHDVSEPHEGQPYRDVFELPANGPAGRPPENDYWFDYQDARFVVLDSNVGEDVLRDTIAPWLVAAFERAPLPRWRFVSLHHPAYSVGKHGDEGRVQRTLVPAFEAANVDIVFCGHDHHYQRTRPMIGGKTAPDERGVTYVVTGAGGAGLYRLRPREEWPDYFVTANNEKHSFTHATIAGDSLAIRQIDIDGATIDEFNITKSVE
ncbi:MAG: metallophosphoesterase [Phycisphaerae bacterium]